MSHFLPSDCAMRSQWRLHFIQGFVQIQGSGLTFSKKIPEGLCNSFQVADLTFERNASEKEKWALLGSPEFVCAVELVTSLHSAADTWPDSSNLCGLRLGRHELCRSEEPI